MDESGGRIEELKKKLFRREAFRPATSRARFSEIREEVKSDWSEGGKAPVAETISTPNMSFFKKLLLGSFIFFVVITGFSVYRFYGNTSVVSPEKIDISVRGPLSVKGGEILPLDISLTNGNAATLVGANLIVVYPLGTRSADNLSKEELRTSRFLGDIPSGTTLNESFRTVLFGAEQTEQKILVTLEYRIAGSNAIFPKEKEYTVTLSSSPVNIVVSLPDEVNTNQEVELSVGVVSNATDVLKNLLLEVNYPPGFSFKSASPEPAFGSGIWNVGDLSAGAERTIKIRGVIEGQDEETKAFRITVGVREEGNERKIAVPYQSTFETLSIRKPFVGLNVSLNGQATPLYLSTAGEKIRGDISWVNNLPGKILDGEITVRLIGSTFDKTSVTASKGFYRSSDNVILWTSQDEPELEEIQPGGTGHVTFSLSALSLASLRSLGVNAPEFTLEVNFTGRRVAAGAANQNVDSTITRAVRIQTNANLAGKVLYFAGPFTNTGPIPPRVDQETSYTIVWSLNSSFNNVSDVEVSAILPSYVKWLNVKSPQSEDISFDTSRGAVVWNVGTLQSGTAVREVAFQVSMQASLSQVGESPTLVQTAKLTGTDAFTNSPVTAGIRELTTRLFAEPTATEEQGRVAN